jgi:hypothetical protein
MKDELSDFRKLRDDDLLDRYVSVTQAATILGYASYVSVNELIQKKKITPYWLPGNCKKKILLSDLNKLLAEARSRPAPKKRGKGRPSII